MINLDHTNSPWRADATEDWLALDRQLCFALYSASLAMTKRYRPLLEPLGLTYPQYLVMLAMWQRDGRGVGDLGEALSLDSGTLTPLLKRLEAAALIRRERSRGDERRVEVHLTEAGAALRERAASVPLQMAEAIGCSLHEIGTLTRELHRLRLALLPADRDTSDATSSLTPSTTPT